MAEYALGLIAARGLIGVIEATDAAAKAANVVVADILAAGDGEIVMVAYGRAAKLTVGKEDSSIEAAVIGIIDEYDVTPEHYHGDLDPARIKYKESVHEE